MALRISSARPGAESASQLFKIFFPAVTPDIVIRTHRSEQTPGDFSQYFVANAVTVGVVDFFEMIHITQHDRGGYPFAAGPGNFTAQ